MCFKLSASFSAASWDNKLASAIIVAGDFLYLLALLSSAVRKETVGLPLTLLSLLLLIQELVVLFSLPVVLSAILLLVEAPAF
jgi:hypothetical protein